MDKNNLFSGGKNVFVKKKQNKKKGALTPNPRKNAEKSKTRKEEEGNFK